MTDTKLMQSVKTKWGADIASAVAASSLPASFLAALVANESGGHDLAVRFEPAVYRHLAAVASGQSPNFGSIRKDSLIAGEAQEFAKADEFHALNLDATFASDYQALLQKSDDEGLREYASSWGLTQIMGYNLISDGILVPANLLDPQISLAQTVRMLSEFAERFQLDLAADFADLFACWNTGQPDCSKTYDPNYCANGLARKTLYESL